MKSDNTLFKFIFSKRFLTLFAIISIYLIFRHQIEYFIDKTFVDNVLYDIEPTATNDVIILLALSLFSIYCLRYPRRVYLLLDKWKVCYLVFFLFLYAYHRIWGNTWSFTSFYIDIIAISGLILIEIWMYFNNKKDTFGVNEMTDFIEDEPINNFFEDKLGYDNYAKEITDKLLSGKFEKSFAVGINGKWGSGKTSFMNLIKSELQKNENNSIIEIDFNPWSCNSPQSIIKDFFDEIRNGIDIYPKLTKLLYSYSNKLVAPNNKSLTLSPLLSTPKSVKSLYDDINLCLKKLNKKLFIYIDDVDRLNKEEIIEVIKLIRNTGNFHNTVFIVSYDRDYVINALKKHELYNYNDFLEKIFQLEINLPYFRKEKLRQKLVENLKTLLVNLEIAPKNIYQIIDKSIPIKENSPKITSKNLIYDSFFDWNLWLDNMRDVTRLTNTFMLHYPILIGEVEFDDLLKLELLKLKFPSVYDLLFQQKSTYITTTKYNTYILSKDNILNKTKLELFLETNHENLHIRRNDIGKIASLINDVFRLKLNTPLSVIYPSKFEIYSTYSLLGVLSEKEFSRARTNLIQDEFNRKIEKWVDDGFEVELCEKFELIDSYNDVNDFEKIVTAIFYLGNLNSRKPNKEYIEYSLEDLLRKLSIFELDNDLVTLYRRENKNENNLNNFIDNLLRSAKPPYHFESKFMAYINNDSNNKIIIDNQHFIKVDSDNMKDIQ